MTALTTKPRFKRGDTVRYIGPNDWYDRRFTVLARLTPHRQSGLMLGYEDQAYEVCIETRANGRCRVRRVVREKNLEAVAS